VALRGGKGGRKTHRAYDDQNYRIGVREIQTSAAHFAEQKQHSNRNNNGRTHQAADGAAPAGTTDSITHRSSSPKIRPNNCLQPKLRSTIRY
jgi:hypothetical protein